MRGFILSFVNQICKMGFGVHFFVCFARKHAIYLSISKWHAHVMLVIIQKELHSRKCRVTNIA